MKATVLLITPPFTQLNTPYPATPYLKGFLHTINCSSYQMDLGIETFLTLFSRKGLQKLFLQINRVQEDENMARIISLQEAYCDTIDDVILFLQGKNPTLAYTICQENLLPQASRFDSLDDTEEVVGIMGIQNRAKHLCTLYIEDLFDLITASVDPRFGLNRYAERLGRSADSFDELHASLQEEPGYVENLFISLLDEKVKITQPELVALSIPFPGNLFSGLRCAQWIKKNYPGISIALGGGFVNTELRQLSDPRIFDLVDYVILDDGEAPITCVLEHMTGKRPVEQLKRCFTRIGMEVVYIDNAGLNDYPVSQTGIPDYTDLLLDTYVSLIETANPMHSLWTDGRWNKLTMAHGCYWAKCSFCDTSLNYINQYKPLTAVELCDRIETLMQQTGQSGFHFTDEAAPPALMHELALEILRRKLNITWWTNIRFEKNFTSDLCYLLSMSGCIAVSGGLEVASNRLLTLMNKGVTVEQVAQVAGNFTQAGIMVHAYLMYGFPTQTAQETIDSLEMVRQLFEERVVYSAFWHKFTMTVHSPIGMCPDKFGVKALTNTPGTFANNDMEHQDPTGAKHAMFGEGLKTALYNYMHGVGFDIPLHRWFQFRTPPTRIQPDIIAQVLARNNDFLIKPTNRLIWLGNKPLVKKLTRTKKGKQVEHCSLTFHTRTAKVQIEITPKQGEWLVSLLDKVDYRNNAPHSITEIKTEYESCLHDNFELFFYSKPMEELRNNGLLCL